MADFITLTKVIRGVDFRSCVRASDIVSFTGRGCDVSNMTLRPISDGDVRNINVKETPDQILALIAEAQGAK
ncbi:hypothetical protein ABHV46_10965 [Asaia sp. BMEF1]|uniref:hypothetical protein n=1 Tax=Asaia sp. BMEF1 TaxID=3155932 RepID=UPI003F67A407